MIRDSRDKYNLLNRLQTAQGHMRAIEKMIADEAPSTEILRQMLAVRGAWCAIRRELWRAYLLDEDCGLRYDEEKQRVQAWCELEEALVGEL